MMSRHRLCLAYGGHDIICTSCYEEVVKGGTKFPLNIKNANGGIMLKI